MDIINNQFIKPSLITDASMMLKQRERTCPLIQTAQRSLRKQLQITDTVKKIHCPLDGNV